MYIFITDFFLQYTEYKEIVIYYSSIRRNPTNCEKKNSYNNNQKTNKIQASSSRRQMTECLSLKGQTEDN